MSMVGQYVIKFHSFASVLSWIHKALWAPFYASLSGLIIYHVVKTFSCVFLNSSFSYQSGSKFN